MPRLHRNNAAEWIMAIALAPVAWARRFFAKRPHELQTSPVTKRVSRNPASRGVAIEGLPPRTMN